MKVSEVDINRIGELLKSVPSEMEITSIDLTDGYSLNLIAGEKQIYDANMKASVAELNNLIKELELKRISVENETKKEKSYLPKSDDD